MQCQFDRPSTRPNTLPYATRSFCSRLFNQVPDSPSREITEVAGLRKVKEELGAFEQDLPSELRWSNNSFKLAVRREAAGVSREQPIH
jgi:hypothetical protein